MKTIIIKQILFIFTLLSLSFTNQEEKITVYLIGDSTMSVKEQVAYPETGWGMPFVYFFDSTVKVENRAVNGRSTKTFISENRWHPIVSDLKPGDYVFIQFGHNDESIEKKERYTTPDEYKANLTRFINETRINGGNPVLLTPVGRRKFDDNGKVVETHEVYSELVREVAKEQDVAFIDLDKRSQQLYQEMGVETSKLLFLHLDPGQHPNYPDGKVDNTHFNELGARLIAEIVLEEARLINLGLVSRIVKKN